MMLTRKFNMRAIFYMITSITESLKGKKNMVKRKYRGYIVINMSEITPYHVDCHTNLSTVFPNPEMDVIEKCLGTLFFVSLVTNTTFVFIFTT